MASKQVNLGAMNKRLRLERAAVVDDGGGGKGETWQPLKTVWGSLKPADERGESLMFKGRRVQPTHHIHTRWRSDVDLKEDDRIVFRQAGKDRIFNILRVINMDERKRYWKVIVNEYAGA